MERGQLVRASLIYTNSALFSYGMFARTKLSVLRSISATSTHFRDPTPDYAAPDGAFSPMGCFIYRYFAPERGLRTAGVSYLANGGRATYATFTTFIGNRSCQ